MDISIPLLEYTLLGYLLKVNIPTVPICSDGPEAAAAAPSRGRPRGQLHPKVHMLRESLHLFGLHFCKKCKVDTAIDLCI